MHRPTTASGPAFGGPVAVSLCLHLAFAGALLGFVGSTTVPVPAPAVIATPFTVVPYVAISAARAPTGESAKAVPVAAPVQAAAAPVPQAPVPQAPVARAPRAPSPVRPSPVPAAAAPEAPQAAPPRPETVAVRRDAPETTAPSPEAVTATELPVRSKTPPPPTPTVRPATAVVSGPTGDPTAPPVDRQAASAIPAAPTAVPAVPGRTNGPAGDIARPIAAAAGNPVPAYPRQARLKGWEGTVVLAVTVGPDGRCRSLAVARSSGFAVLDRAALQAVRHWRFAPARRNGLAVEAVAEVPVTFRLT